MRPSRFCPRYSVLVLFGVSCTLLFMLMITQHSSSQYYGLQIPLSFSEAKPQPVLKYVVREQKLLDDDIDSLAEITAYLKNEEALCLAMQRLDNKMSMPSCPCLPPGLLGRRPVNKTDDADEWIGIERRVGHSVIVGGHWQPPDCRANTRLAVIIPYRDRESHLRIMLRHLYPILQRQLAHFRIFVVEQNSPTVFNKAAMMNIGFLEAQKRFPDMNCVMFHDVDHLVEDDRTLMNCGPEARHFAASLDEWNYRLIYGGLFGGVVTMRPEFFVKVNGYSLQYFGWGGEDDDMGSRKKVNPGCFILPEVFGQQPIRVRQNSPVFRPPLVLCRYSTIEHDVDTLNPKNPGRVKLMNTQYDQYVNGTFRGLTEVNYELNDYQLRPLFTWLHVNLNISRLLQFYPNKTGSSYTYRKSAGVCRWDGHVTRKSGDFSRVTCQFLCDDESQRPCIGYTYRSQPDQSEPVRATSDGVRVKMIRPPKCLLMRTGCELVDKSIDKFAVTYIKERFASIST